MKLTLIAALFLSNTSALGGWGACPDIPALDDGKEEREIDKFGKVSHAVEVDLNI